MQDPDYAGCQSFQGDFPTDGTETATCFTDARILPPTTAKLDVGQILNCSKHRHIMNFSQNFFIDWNLDRTAMQTMRDYYNALVGELSVHMSKHRGLFTERATEAKAYWTGCRGTRIPMLLNTIHHVVLTLVPNNNDKDLVQSHLDAAWQEIENGVYNLVSLADCLSEMLKKHCTPQRDVLVDSMRNEVTRGATEDNAPTLANGFMHLLDVLEIMKLDVVNYQLAKVKQFVIDNEVKFQWDYNAHQIQAGEIDVAQSYNWLEAEIARSGSTSQLEALTSALLRALLWNDDEVMYPQTFDIDSDRLDNISNGMRADIFHGIVHNILQELMSSRLSSEKLPELTASSLKAKVVSAVGFGPEPRERIDHITAELERFIREMDNGAVLDAAAVSGLKHRLDRDLDPHSPAFESLAQTTFNRILPKLQTSVAEHVEMTPASLHDRLVQSDAMGGAKLFTQQRRGESVVRELTHMVVLHWQSWQGHVYPEPPKDDGAAISSRSCVAPPSSPEVCKSRKSSGC